MKPATAPALSFNRAPFGTLQRKCACGGSGRSGGECEECEKKKATLQRRAVNGTELGDAPPIVYEVLRSSGRPLDKSIRDYLEPRFGHDFSRIRVHDDAEAGDSANALNAEAYTVGSHIVFGPNRYHSDSIGGVHLIAHELAHSVQQSGQNPTLQKSLRVGGVDDPAEAAAEGAANAVLHSNRIPSIAPSEPVIRRRWVRAPTPDKNVRKVWDDIDPKTIYYVTRKRDIEAHTSTQWCPPSVTAGADRVNVWLRIEWCRGARGRVEIGADIPQELQNLIRDLVHSITSGGSAEDVVKKTNFAPYVNVVITKSGSWQLSSGIHITVGPSGVTGGGGQIGLEKEGWGKFSLEGGSEEVGGGKRDIRGMLKWTIPLGKVPRFECPVREKVTLVEVVKFTCEKYVFVPPKVPDFRTRYIYFQWASTDLNNNLAGEGDLTSGNLSALITDFKEGYRVSTITGFTSPEGPMGRLGRFEGNTKLAAERAEKAKDHVKDACLQTMGTWGLSPQLPRLSMRPSNPLDGCFVGGEKAVVPRGCGEGTAPRCTGGELYTKVVAGKELKGRKLTEFAVPAFEGAENEPQRTPELVKQLEQKKTLKEKAELIYPKLRRAEIVLVGQRTLKQGEVGYEKGTLRPSDEPCPPAAIKSAFPEKEEGPKGIPLLKCKGD